MTSEVGHWRQAFEGYTYSWYCSLSSLLPDLVASPHTPYLRQSCVCLLLYPPCFDGLKSLTFCAKMFFPSGVTVIFVTGIRQLTQR